MAGQALDREALERRMLSNVTQFEEFLASLDPLGQAALDNNNVVKRKAQEMAREICDAAMDGQIHLTQQLTEIHMNHMASIQTLQSTVTYLIEQWKELLASPAETPLEALETHLANLDDMWQTSSIDPTALEMSIQELDVIPKADFPELLQSAKQSSYIKRLPVLPEDLLIECRPTGLSDQSFELKIMNQRSDAGNMSRDTATVVRDALVTEVLLYGRIRVDHRRGAGSDLGEVTRIRIRPNSAEESYVVHVRLYGQLISNSPFTIDPGTGAGDQGSLQNGSDLMDLRDPTATSSPVIDSPVVSEYIGAPVQSSAAHQRSALSRAVSIGARLPTVSSRYSNPAAAQLQATVPGAVMRGAVSAASIPQPTIPQVPRGQRMPTVGGSRAGSAVGAGLTGLNGATPTQETAIPPYSSVRPTPVVAAVDDLDDEVYIDKGQSRSRLQRDTVPGTSNDSGPDRQRLTDLTNTHAAKARHFSAGAGRGRRTETGESQSHVTVAPGVARPSGSDMAREFNDLMLASMGEADLPPVQPAYSADHHHDKVPFGGYSPREGPVDDVPPGKGFVEETSVEQGASAGQPSTGYIEAASLRPKLESMARSSGQLLFRFVRSFGKKNESEPPETCFCTPIGCSFDEVSKSYIICDTGHAVVKVFGEDGRPLQLIGDAGTFRMHRPSAALPLGDGTLVVREDEGFHHVQMDGTLITSFGHMKKPYGLACASNGDILTIGNAEKSYEDRYLHKFDRRRLDAPYATIPLAGLSPPSSKQYPRTMPRFMDAYQDRVYISDLGSQKVYVSDAVTGQELKTFGVFGRSPGNFNQPSGISVDGDGHLLIGDAVNHRIQYFSNTGEFICGVKLDRSLARPSDIQLTRKGELMVMNLKEHTVDIFQLVDK